MNQFPPSPTSSRCTTNVVDTCGKWKKSSIINVQIILFGQLWEVQLTYRYTVAFKFTLRSKQPDIIPIICHWCHWHRWQIYRRCHWYLWQISTGVVDTGGKFATTINSTSRTGGEFAAGVDTGGKFSTGVGDSGGASWLCIFSKKFETVLMGYSGFGETDSCR